MIRYIPSPRNLNWLVVFGCVFLMAVALYFQHVMLLEPCPMCVFQRMAVIGTGVIAFVAAIHNPQQTGVRIYGATAALASLIGAGISIRHLYLQSLPEDQVPACGPGLDYLIDVFPMTDVIMMVLQGDGSCAEVLWSFLGISIPGWVLLAFLGLIALTGYQVVRKESQPA
ncbi:MAG: disulfide bond formation protein B [Gammaproteobacteria bacterium]|nr:disulfide bond formation protein B [Gammaproteobacteria bacterium]MBT7372214.1 disulfide bond formation protein B [Gammaproteobacteria bacterium]